MLKRPIGNSPRLFLAVAVAAATSLTGCVDQDYDLTKDIDLKITLGGQELHLPTSSTQELTMQQLLDIDPQTSSIKVVETQGHYGLNVGDYVLVQEGTETRSEIDIDKVSLSELHGDRTSTVLQFPLVAGIDEIVTSTGLITSTLHIEDSNVDPMLVELSSADVDLSMDVKVNYTSDTYRGNAKIKQGFKISFPDSWTVELADNATGSFISMPDTHTMIFTQDKNLSGNGFNIAIKVSHFTLGNKRGEGLYAPGQFYLESDITFEGEMAIANTNNQTGVEDVNLITDTHINSAVINSVTGRVNPAIDIADTSVEINDIPDFLADASNDLDINDPQIYFYVTNTSPVEATVNAMLKAYSDNNQKIVSVGIGSNHGTQEIRIPANCTSCILLTKHGDNINHVYTFSQPVDYVQYVAVPDLGDLLRTVPDKIEISQVEARADQNKTVTFKLGAEGNYRFNTNYEAVVPFSFGKDLFINYETTDDGWDEDLEKYNFDTVVLTATAFNSTPLQLHPVVEALGSNGQVLTNITATVDRDILGGSIAIPAETPVRITLRSTGENIKDLQGIRIVFEGTIDPSHAGAALNKDQSVRFADIQISITGGITIDLND